MNWLFDQVCCNSLSILNIKLIVSALVYFSTPIAGFTNGLVAYGTAKNLVFTHGIHSWQWLFIVEGIPTLALGLAIFFLLPGEPQKVAENGHMFFKSPEERQLLLQR